MQQSIWPVIALFFGCLLGPALLIRVVRRSRARRVRLGVYCGLATLVAVTAALDSWTVLYWKEANRALGGALPESIGVAPLSDRVLRDPVHPQFVKRSVVWVEEWSGDALNVEYDRNGRLVGVREWTTGSLPSRVAWWLNIAAFSTLVGALLVGAARLQERWMRR